MVKTAIGIVGQLARAVISVIFSQAVLYGCHLRGYYPERQLATWALNHVPTEDQLSFAWWTASAVMSLLIYWGISKLTQGFSPKMAVASDLVRTPLVDQSFPGFSTTLGIELRNAAAARRQYFFDYVTPEKARVSLYFSATDVFVFAVSDVHQETYTIEIPLGNRGLPLHEFIYLTCQVGITSNESYMSVFKNETELKQKIIGLRVDLGSRQWHQGTIGADISGNNNAPFMVSSHAMGHVTLTDKNINDLIRALRQYMAAISADNTKVTS